MAGKGGGSSVPTTKRFKAAVQTAFGQRGWTKGEEVTWKDVAHLVGLYEEDEETEWARILAEGPGGTRRYQRPREQGGKQQQQHQPKEGGDRTHSLPTSPCFLNLHHLVRGSPLPTQPQTQQPKQQPGHTSKQTAAGAPPGDPRDEGEEQPKGEPQRMQTTTKKTFSSGTACSLHADLDRGG